MTEASDAFEAFYRGQVDAVYRALAVTLGDPDLAREATDEAMLRAYANWPKIGAYDSPSAWAFRVGLTWATSRWRRRRRETSGAEAKETSVAEPDPAAAAALAAVGRLGGRQRAVVVCRVLLDLSTAETAAALGIAEGTVRSRLARALVELRSRLTGDER